MLPAGALENTLSMMMGDVQSRGLQPKKTPITDDYELSNKVLGLGINGKVVVCYNKTDNRKCALKVTCFSFYFIGKMNVLAHLDQWALMAK